ncbi:hypothetical protein G9A89_002939 [Geosiphon pyriformis]|nr:hypothetical protein G9A89_002939 [Geosiphon pyriformis]
MIKKTKSSEKWEQLLVSAIVIPNPFVVSNEILDEISVVLSDTSSKIGLDQPLLVLPNVVSSGRSLPVLEAKQSFPVGLSVLVNWTDQIETESSFPLAVFQSVHGFLGAKSVSKDNVKLFCMEFTSQTSLDAVFLVELTSSVCLITLKIAKSLVVSESGSSSAAVVLCDMPLSVSAADIKTAFSVFGMVIHVVLKSAGIWQYVVVYFEKLDFAMSALNYWFKAKLVNFPPGCTVFEISNMISQVGGRSCFIPWSPNSGHYLHFALVTFGFQADLDLVIANTGHLAVDCKVALSLFPKAPKMFKPHFVGSLSYAKTFALSVMSDFSSLVAFVSPVAVVDPVVRSRLDSLEKQISDLAALVKSIVEPVGFLVVLVSHFFDDNAVKTVKLEKNFLSMKYASNNFANLLVGVSKDIACFRSEVDFSGIDYDDMQAAKPFFLSENTVKHVIALWRMSNAKIRSSVESTRLFLSEFIFDSRNLNGIIEKICGLGLFSLLIILA